MDKTNLSVLLVDDDPHLVVLKTSMLGSIPLEAYVIVAMSAEKGLESFTNYKPDLVLLHIEISGMNGIQMLKAIRKINATTPVILMSEIEHDTEALEAVGMTKFLREPFNMDQLVRCINAALRKQQKS